MHDAICTFKSSFNKYYMIIHVVFLKRLKTDSITFGRLIEMTFLSFDKSSLTTQNTKMYFFVYLFIWLWLISARNRTPNVPPVRYTLLLLLLIIKRHINGLKGNKIMKQGIIRVADSGISERGGQARQNSLDLGIVLITVHKYTLGVTEQCTSGLYVRRHNVVKYC